MLAMLTEDGEAGRAARWRYITEKLTLTFISLPLIFTTVITATSQGFNNAIHLPHLAVKRVIFPAFPTK